MTDSEFQSEVANLSPKIQDLLGKANGAGISTELGSLAQNLTGTSDLSAALDALKADPAKLAALEDQVASKLATPGPGSTPTSTSATAPTVPAPAPTSTPSGNSVQTSSPTSTTVVTTPSATPPPPNPWPAGRGYMWVAPAVSLAVLLGFFGMLATLLYFEYHAGATATTGGNANPIQNVLFTLLGALGAAFTQVVNFWLGSSKGSSDKTDLLAAANPVPGPGASTTTVAGAGAQGPEGAG